MPPTTINAISTQYRVDGGREELDDETDARWEDPIIVDAYEVISDADWQRDVTQHQRRDETVSKSPKTSREEAMDFLVECLQSPKLSDHVYDEGTRLHLSKRTIDRAKKALGVKSKKSPAG